MHNEYPGAISPLMAILLVNALLSTAVTTFN
jgi:hypothetical protein